MYQLQMPATKRQRSSIFGSNTVRITSSSLSLSYPHRRRKGKEAINTINTTNTTETSTTISSLFQDSDKKSCTTRQRQETIKKSLQDTDVDISINMNMMDCSTSTESTELTESTESTESRESTELHPKAPILTSLECSSSDLEVPNLSLLTKLNDNNDNQCNYNHSTIRSHRINEYNDDGNEDQDIQKRDKYSLLDILNSMERLSID